MDRLLWFFLSRFVRQGTFHLTTARGTLLVFGDGTGAPVAARITTVRAEIAILLDPELKVGECYMNGTFVVEQGSIADALALLMHARLRLGEDRREASAARLYSRKVRSTFRWAWGPSSLFLPRPRWTWGASLNFDDAAASPARSGNRDHADYRVRLH